MTVHGLVVAFTLGAAALAVWLDCRSAGRAPRSLGRVFGHLLVGLLATALVPVLMAQLATQDSPARAIAALVALLLPAFVYCFLTWIWLLRLVQRLVRFG
jgi:hypothetical protein